MASSEMSPYLQSFEKIAFLKAYKCSQCNRIYSTQIHNGYICGRVPLLLSCSHSICEECIQKMVKFKTIICKICNYEMAIDDDSESFRTLFPIDRYMFGALLHQGMPEAKPKCNDRPKYPQQHVPSYQPAGTSIKNRGKKEPQKKHEAKKVAKKCSLAECSKDAEWMCNTCCETFCSMCDQQVHSSLKILRMHTRHSIEMAGMTDFSTSCEKHPDVTAEYTCTTCQHMLCSNCVIKMHSGHDVISIEDQNMAELEAFKETRQKAAHILRCMKATQHKINQDINSGTQVHKPSTVEYDIIKHFAELHSRLQILEIRMLEQFFKAKTSRNSSLQDISNNLEDNIKILTPLVEAAKIATSKEYMEKNLITKLNETLIYNLQLPCELIENSETCDKIEFTCDSNIIDTLENHCQVNFESNDSFSLNPITDFPEDISSESITTDDTDSIRSGASSLLSAISSVSTKESTYGQTKCKTVVSLAGRSPVPYHFESTAKKYDQKPADEPFLLLPGTIENVFVTHLMNPSSFYIQLTRKSKEIDCLTARYENYAKSVAPPTTLEINENYIVQFKTEKTAKWYRARMISVKETDTELLYEMFFIDYGNTAPVPLSKIRPMKQIFMKEDAFAYKCRLDGIIAQRNEWNQDVLEYMIKFITGIENPPLLLDELSNMLLDECRSCYLKLQIIKNRKGILEVDLIANNESLRYALCFVGHATSVSTAPTLPKITPTNSFKQTKIMPSIVNYKKNQVNNIRITNIVNPHHFYVQRLDIKKDINMLEDGMTKYYNKNSKLIFTPEPGMYCASLCESDKKWRRTEIISCPGDGQVEVFFLDYGTTEISQWTEHRKLNEKHKQMDAQAIRACLSDVEPINEKNWSAEAVNFFQKYCEFNVFKMYVNDNSKHQLYITLFDSTPAKDICINALLVKKDYAESTGESSLLVEYHKIVEANPEKVENIRYMEQLINKIQTYPDEPVETKDIKGKTYHVAVEVISIESPSCFYVTPIKWVKEKAILQQQLAKLYGNVISPEKTWEVDEFCVVRSTRDNHYYRGWVTKVLDNNVYEIFMRDIIRSENVPTQNLFEIDNSFTNRDLSIKCSLSGLKPTGGTDKWPSMTLEYFHELVSKYNQLYITKQGEILNKTLPVSLLAILETDHGPLEPSSIKQVILNRCLLESGLALPVKVEPLPDEFNDTLTEISESCSENQNSWLDFDQVETEANSGDNLINNSCVQTWLPPYRISETRFKAWPSYVDENGHVYIQNIKARSILKNIGRILNSQYLKSAPDPPHEWKVGQMCIVQYHLDKSFNRGTVVSTKPNGVIVVKLVDYGNEEECSHSELRSEITQIDLPVMTVKCVLSQVYPKTNDGTWPIPVLDTLHHMVVDKECEVVVVDNDTSTGILSIMLTVDHTSVNNEVMQWDWNKTEGMVVSGELSGDDDESVVIEGELEENVEEIAYVDADLNIPEIHMQYRRIRIPEGKLSFEAVIINVLDYKTVMIEASFMAENIRNTEAQFDALLADINAVAPYQSLLPDIVVGTPCVALFDSDNSWYRAEIYEISDPENPKVLFVDYGNLDNVPLENIRVINQNWVQFPVQMIKCKIYNIEKSAELDDKTAVEYMLSILMDKHYICNVVAVEPELQVKLIDKETFELAYKELTNENLFYFTD